MAIHQTPDEMQRSKRSIYITGMEASSYLRSCNEAEAYAENAIRDYARVFRGDPAIALLRIAARLSTDPEQRLINAVAELLAWSDPEELDPCADETHDAVDEYTTFQRGV